MAAPWFVPVTSLRRTPGAQRREVRSAPLGALRVADTSVPAGAPATAEVTLTAVDGGVEVAGTVSVDWEAACRRCLRPVQGRLVADVRELYRPPGPGRDADEETYELGADQLDLEPLVRDAVLLGLPLAPLCSADCPGLCPTCGADRSAGPCGCAPVPADPRWGALDVLRRPETD